MRAIGEKDDERECVAQYEFADSSHSEQDAAEEEAAGPGCYRKAARSTPAHCTLLESDLATPRPKISRREKWLYVLKSIDSGKRAIAKPMIPRGVGLPNVLRRSPFTSVFGLR